MTTPSVDSFVNLPGPVKGMLAVFGITTIGGLMYMMGGAWWIIGLGLLGVGGVLLTYRLILNKRKKLQSKSLEGRLTTDAGKSPLGLPADIRARQEDLRNMFKEGLVKFREHGKDLYSLPWYVLVGEPGAGKTEAIRHSSLPFPPGLQEQQQGFGGTRNMHWWFTTKAIILDTAGRIFFEDAEPSASTEWTEFLKALTRHRPNCPINGLILVIPADSLITDTADEIQAKAQKIAHQLDNMKRQIGVRFPAYVIITKCDRILGFREYFDSINDPELQHQILGWSNSNELDEPFNGELVNQAMGAIRQQLLRRRMGLLIDPVNTEDPEKLRMEQVDKLYAFPDSLYQLTGRIRSYLETIFIGGEWAPKPLFFRGLYFTSSLQQGAELDAELATALGIDPEKLPGSSWEKQRSFFLRNVFTEKVFQEGGLVTRERYARKAQRRRRAIMIAAGFLFAGVLGTLIGLGTYKLKDAIGGQADYWRQMADKFPRVIDDRALERFRLVDQKAAGIDQPWKYRGEPDSNPMSDEMSIVESVERTTYYANEPIRIPNIFRPIAGLSGDLKSEERKKVSKLLIEELVVYRPILEDIVRKRLGTDIVRCKENPNKWSSYHTEALAHLLRLEVRAAGLSPSAAGKNDSDLSLSPVLIDAWLKYILHNPNLEGEDSDAEYNKYLDKTKNKSGLSDQQLLATALRRTYPDHTAPLPQCMGAGTADSMKLVCDGVNQFIAYWKSQQGDDDLASQYTNDSKLYGLLTTLKTSIQAFDAKERALLQFVVDYKKLSADANDLVEANRLVDRWGTELENLKYLAKDMDKKYEAVILALASDLETGKSIVEQATVKAEKEILKAVGVKYKILLDELPPEGSKPEQATPNQGTIYAIRDTLISEKRSLDEGVKSRLLTLKDTLSEYETRYLAFVDRRDKKRPYENRLEMYALVGKTYNDLVNAAQTNGLGGQVNGAADSRDATSIQFPPRRSFMTIVDRLQLSHITGMVGAVDAGKATADKKIAELLDLLPKRDETESDSPAANDADPAVNTTYMVGIAAKAQRTEIIKKAIIMIPDSPDMCGQKVAECVDADRKIRPKKKPDIHGSDGFNARGSSDNENHIFKNEHHPDAINQLFKSIESVTKYFGNETTEIFDSEITKDQYEDQISAFNVYIDTCQAYWIDQIKIDSKFKPVEDWRAFQSLLKDINSYYTNADLIKLYETVIEALGQLPGSCGSEESREKRIAWIAYLTESLDHLKSHKDNFVGLHKNWDALDDDPAKARRELIKFVQKNEIGKFLMPYVDNCTKVIDSYEKGDKIKEAGVYYWAVMAKEGLRLLADYSENETDKAINEIKRYWKRYPIVIPDSSTGNAVNQLKPMTKEDFEKLKTEVEKLGAQESTEKQIQKTGDKDIDDSISKIMGHVDDDNQKWLDKIKVEMTWLDEEKDGPIPIRYRLYLQPDKGFATTGKYPYLTITNGNQAIGQEKGYTIRGIKEEIEVEVTLTISPGNTNGLVFTFSNNAAGTTLKKYNAPWTLLERILRRDDDGNIKIPVPGAGAYPIRVKAVEVELPKANDWLKVSDWPDTTPPAGASRRIGGSP